MNSIYLCILLLLASCGRAPDPPVTVFAAASLRETVTEIADAWSKRTGGTVRAQFDATSTLGRQIGEGAKADLFLTAAPEWLDRVKTVEHFDWLSNRLVLVVPKDAKAPDLQALESLSLANDQVPAGRYAKAALEHLKIPLPARVIYGASVRDVLSKVSQGGAQAGVVYATDPPIDPGVRIVFSFPPESHPRIVYSAGLLTPAGRALFDELRQPWAMEIAEGRGFIR